MTATFKIHPAIGVARVGNSEQDFYIGPERLGELPIDCDRAGNPVLDAQGDERPVQSFKDASSRIKRQAARFRVYVYNDGQSDGRELLVGDQVEVTDKLSGRRITGELVDIHWSVYLANKKASFYEFQQLDGEHGYAASHPLRNADIVGDGPRGRLIIDPGPRTVKANPESARRASFSRDPHSPIPQSFPPPLVPHDIDTLGDLLVTPRERRLHLLVLGGHGRSGSMKTGFGEPKISHYANNDGWFDDTSDGPVSAQLELKVVAVNGVPRPADSEVHVLFPVQQPAWVVVGYPRYAPQITDMVTMDDTVFDLAVREQAFRPELFGVPPFARSAAVNAPGTAAELAAWRRSARWNPQYHPYFWRDIWPILSRPDRYKWVMDFDPFTGGDPHNPTPGAGGVFDPSYLSTPPSERQTPAEREALRQRRQAIFQTLRQPGQENLYQLPTDPSLPGWGPVGMPDLCGDNPISNTAPSKFLRLTETMLFLLRQWAEGHFVDERAEHFDDGAARSAPAGEELDRGVLANVLGGSFCPGAEACWILRSPAVYSAPYRVNPSQNPTPGSLSLGVALEQGLEPGDITRYSSVPWQSDFNECSSQDIDITYSAWNKIDLASIGDPAQAMVQTLYWWPAHRPMQVFAPTPSGPGAPIVPISTAGSQVLTSGVQVPWSRDIPASYEGDLLMVRAWSALGFLRRNEHAAAGDPEFIEVEASWPAPVA